MSLDGTLPRAPSLADGLRRLDPRVVVPALLLTGLGLSALASTRPDLVGTQLSGLAVAVAAAGALVLLPYRVVMASAVPLYLAALALLALTLVPGIGHGAKGARRWIGFGGVQFQPSEFAKVAHLLLLATYIRFRRDHRTFRGLFVPFLLTLVPSLLVFLEPDLGTALLFVPCLFTMLWTAGARTRHLVTVVVFGVLSLPAFYPAMKPYQRSRLHTFLPLLDDVVGKVEDDGKAPPGSDGYHVKQAIVAVAGGRVTGQGWAEGRMNLSRGVPEDWTDFIFVVHAEEWGFVGVALVGGLWAALLLGLASLAREIREPAGKLLCVGAMTSLGVQGSLNMLMNLGAAPVTGVPLPFFSYGRSAMLSAWLLLGLALHARAREPRTFARGDFD